MKKFQNGACDLLQPSAVKDAFEEESMTDADTRVVIITDSKAKLPKQSSLKTTIINVGDEKLNESPDVVNLIELQQEFTTLDLPFQSHIKK